jgi:hypothetical protein
MYTSFDLSRQAEEMAYEWAEYVEVLEEIARQTKIREMQTNKRNLRNGIRDLCEYGMRVGFLSIEFYSACEEAFVNADRPIALLLESNGVETVDEFVMFVRGCGFVMEG